MRNKTLFWILFYAGIFFIIFKNTFTSSTISGGDYITFFPENISYLKNFSFSTWDNTINLGSNTLDVLHFAPYGYFTGWIGKLVGYNVIVWERLSWWLPFFFISFFSILQFIQYFLPKNPFRFLVPLLFLFNTYILLIVGGGQIAGIGLAYAITPLVFTNIVKPINLLSFDNYKKIKNQRAMLLRTSFIAGVTIALQGMFDLRITYITLVALVLYLLIHIHYTFSKNSIFINSLLVFYAFIIPLGIVMLIHSFWITPMLLLKVNPIEQLGSAYNSISIVRFLSFAKLEDTISLLHPNWPENIFGKVYFMRPEFLFVPLLAYVSLLFLRNSKFNLPIGGQNVKSESEIQNYAEIHYILFFAALGAIGSFLAKGANPPFGDMYLWLFAHFPGFVMFRDSTKWYILVVLSYSVLIPFSISSIWNWVNLKLKTKNEKLQFKMQNYIAGLFGLFFILYFLFLIRPALFHRLSGTFISNPIPSEYKGLEMFLFSQNDYSRTLWVPAYQRFGYYSIKHPAIYAQDFFGTTDKKKIIVLLQKPTTLRKLQEAAVNYVIVPFDSEGDIFVKDGKYNDAVYRQTLTQIEQIQSLHEVKRFGKIVVFSVPNTKSHFWISSFSKSSANVIYTMQTPVSYAVTLQNVQAGDRVIFGEAYDPLWQLSVDNNLIKSQPYDKLFNSFVLPKNGNYSMTIQYEAQRWVNIGIIISGVTFGIVMIFLLVTQVMKSRVKR